jgi:hypothetical protein
MSNVFETIGHDVKVGAEDVGKGIEKGVEYAFVHPVEACEKAVQVFETLIKDSPAAKAAVQGLIKAGAKAESDAATAVADKGLNIAVDVAAVTDGETFFSYFKSTFLPAMASVYKDLKTDVESTTPDPAPAQ